MNLLVMLILSLHAHATQPPRACTESECTPEMQAIVSDYETAGPLEETRPLLFSGGCYHLTSLYDPHTQHHGYTLIDTLGADSYMDGLFSFYTKENPYAHIGFDEARDLAPRRFEENHRLDLEPTYAFVDMNKKDPSMVLQYWLRQKDNTLLLIAQWGRDHRVFCRFEKNL